MLERITVSAPGKLMLFGEHAVVYNRPCLVTAVGQRMQATVELTQTGNFELEAPDVKVEGYKRPISELGQGEIPKGAKFVEVAVANFLRHPRPDRGSIDIDSRFRGNDKGNENDKFGVRITTQSEFSSQFGFGSSSASTVCTIKALSEITGANLSSREIFDLAYKTVLDIQGTGSGFDVAAATYGGTLYFVTGGKVIEPLDIDNLPMIVGYSGIKADTVTLINQVKAMADRYPGLVEGIYDQIKDLVERAKGFMIERDWEKVGELMNVNQGYLEALGVGSRKLSDMIYASREVGAYGAKLSGAGVGDCMFALYSAQDKLQIVEAIKKVGGEVIDIKTNEEGVRVENA